jgi:hypothetical protein
MEACAPCRPLRRSHLYDTKYQTVQVQYSTPEANRLTNSGTDLLIGCWLNHGLTDSGTDLLIGCWLIHGLTDSGTDLLIGCYLTHGLTDSDTEWQIG